MTIEFVEKTASSVRAQILEVESAAFGPDEGPIIERLVSDLLDDPTAQPLLSVLAVEGDRPLGHILFTRVELGGQATPIKSSILCPLAVAPEAQSRGIGSQLVRTGLARLRESGTELVFVLGHPGYYPRFGFEPAGAYRLHAPYPIPEKNADAWMVQALQPGILGQVEGTLSCAEALRRPEYWVE